MQIGELINAAIMAVVKAVVPPPPPPKFHMHFDADRDGTVDDRWLGLADWQWGRGKRGAVFFCNNDDDDSAGAADNKDTKVNGGNDKDELAPIVIRKVGATAAPGSWKATLEVIAPADKRVRVFETRTSGAAEVIGPGKGAVYTFPDLSFTEKELGIEALFYAGEDSGWSGNCVIVFQIEDGGSVIYKQTGMMRVAPWMMGHHLEPADKVFVVDAGYNSRFVADLGTMVAAAGCSLQKHPEPGDVWMQDCMEIGYSFMPKFHMPVAMRAKRNRPLQVFPKKLLKPDFGYEEPSPVAARRLHLRLERQPRGLAAVRVARGEEVPVGPHLLRRRTPARKVRPRGDEVPARAEGARRRSTSTRTGCWSGTSTRSSPSSRPRARAGSSCCWPARRGRSICSTPRRPPGTDRRSCSPAGPFAAGRRR